MKYMPVLLKYHDNVCSNDTHVILVSYLSQHDVIILLRVVR